MTMVRDEHGIRFEADDEDWQAVRQARYVSAVQRANDAKAAYERALVDVRRTRKRLTTVSTGPQLQPAPTSA